MSELQTYYVVLSTNAGISYNSQGFVEAEDFVDLVTYLSDEYPGFTVESITKLTKRNL